MRVIFSIAVLSVAIAVPAIAQTSPAGKASPGGIQLICSEWKHNPDGSWTGSTHQGNITLNNATFKNTSESKYLDENCK